MKPVQPSACAWIFVWRASASSISRTSRCDGLNTGSGAPFHESTRDVDALRELREEVAHHDRLFLAREMELGREEPAREMDVRLRTRELGGNRGQRLRAVHEHLEVVSLPRREGAVRVRELGHVEGTIPADVTKAAAVPVAHGVVDPLAEGVPEP